MASFWQRAKAWVNTRIQTSPAFEAQQPTEPILTPEPIYQESTYTWEEIPKEQFVNISITDDYGNYHGTYSYQEWYDFTLIGHERFAVQFGADFYTVELLDLLQRQTGWWGKAEWEQWREDYELANG
jgi:hypothetical protein